MQKEKKIFMAIAVVIAIFCLIPLLGLFGINLFVGMQQEVVAFIAIFGWGLIYGLFKVLYRTGQSLLDVAERVGIEGDDVRLWNLPQKLGEVIQKKNECFALNVLEQKIESKDALSRTLERITATTYQLLQAESVELSLFEKDTAVYHSSFVLGLPFSDNPQEHGFDVNEMLKTDPTILIETIAFAGAIRGMLRAKIKKKKIPTTMDKEIMSLLAKQSTIAIINSEYSNELLRMKHASEASVKVKTGFLANLSHELRGPLGIMLNAVELLIDGLCGEINEDQKETLGMIKQNGSHLLDLMNDVLDYAKVEAGKIVVTKIELSANDLVTDLVKIIRVQADAKKHELIFKPTAENLIFQCDKRHARQILINILTNAVKYTTEGGKIEVWIDHSKHNRVNIHVKDNGVGMEESEQYKVFAPFERVDHTYSSKQMGAGLGMSLAKKLIEVNGGTINFESKPGEGTHFWISFPLFDGTGIAVDNEADDVVVRGNGKSLLIITEDEKSNENLLMKKYLEHCSFNVMTTTEFPSAIAIVKSQPVDLILIENDTLDNLGGDFVRNFRQISQRSSLPIVLISNKGFVFDIEHYLKAGVDRCLTRPVEFKKVAQIVFKLIDESQKIGREKIGQKSVFNDISGAH